MMVCFIHKTPGQKCYTADHVGAKGKATDGQRQYQKIKNALSLQNIAALQSTFCCCITVSLQHKNLKKCHRALGSRLTVTLSSIAAYKNVQGKHYFALVNLKGFLDSTDMVTLP